MYLSGGLGIAFSDLQRGGRNLRLYVNYGPGTPEATDPASHGCAGAGAGDACNPTANLYSTGHYDIGLPGGPCSQPDAKAFTTFANLINYAAARGEVLQQVSYNDVATLCAQQAPATAVAAPGVVGAPIINVTGGPTAMPGAPTGSGGPGTGLPVTTSPAPITGTAYFPTPPGSVDLGPSPIPGIPTMDTSILPYIAIGIGVLLLMR